MKTLTPEQTAAILEIARLSLEIPGSIFNHSSDSKCVSVYSFTKDTPTDYKYNFECFYAVYPEKLRQTIDSLTSYIKENEKSETK